MKQSGMLRISKDIINKKKNKKQASKKHHKNSSKSESKSNHSQSRMRHPSENNLMYGGGIKPFIDRN